MSMAADRPKPPGPIEMSSTAPSVSVSRDFVATASALLQLTKPGVTRLVMVTTLSGALIAPGPVALGQLLVALPATALVVGAANALNMYLERDSDAAMERTRERPLPSGRLAPEVALWFGVALALVGLPLLSFLVNPVTGLLAATALVSYVLVYTPLKRVTPLALHVGAIPGAIPPVIGWASMTGSVDVRAAVLFAILFVWQLPHFLAIAMFRQDEYARAGIAVMPAVRGLRRTKRAAVAYLVLLLVVSLMPALVGLAGVAYTLVAAVLGLGFLGWGVYGLKPEAGTAWARSLFFASLPYLVLIFGALVVSAAWPAL
jgi:heme o synthase